MESKNSLIFFLFVAGAPFPSSARTHHVFTQTASESPTNRDGRTQGKQRLQLRRTAPRATGLVITRGSVLVGEDRLVPTTATGAVRLRFFSLAEQRKGGHQGARQQQGDARNQPRRSFSQAGVDRRAAADRGGG